VIKLDPPLAGVTIAFIDKTTNKLVAYGITDSEGKVTLQVKKGKWLLRASKGGYLVYERDVEITEDTTVEIRLAKIEEYYVPYLKPKMSMSISVETPTPKTTDLSLKVSEVTVEVS